MGDGAVFLWFIKGFRRLFLLCELKICIELGGGRRPRMWTKKAGAPSSVSLGHDSEP